MSIVSEGKVVVEVLKDGRWAIEKVWLPQLEVVIGDKVVIPISKANELQIKGKCRILPEISVDELLKNKAKQLYEVKSITKKELLDLLKDVEDDEMVWAFWDDLVWPIQGISFDRTYSRGNLYEKVENCVCIDCPS